MSVNKKEIISQFASTEKDTGSTPVQVALLTKRIAHLTDHLNRHKKDFGTRRSLLKLAGQRRRLLKYLRRNNPGKYLEILKELKIRGI
jgi:small subunit ribosomal protein S15